MTSDQWKEGGDCKNCRRQKYCRKMCSAKKRSIQEALGQYVKQKIAMGALEDPSPAEEGDPEEVAENG